MRFNVSTPNTLEIIQLNLHIVMRQCLKKDNWNLKKLKNTIFTQILVAQ